MPLKQKIALCEPNDLEDSDRYFSFKLKQDHFIEPTEYNSCRKILIISNIQGKFHYLRELLLHNGVMDESYLWTFGTGHLVIAGNCLGEDGSGAECLWLLYALENRARIRGGYIHFILGKNEINNFNGRWQYLHPKYAQNEKTSRTPYVILYDGNSELKRWLKTKNFIEKIGNFFISNIDTNTDLSALTLSQLNNIARLNLSTNNKSDSGPLLSKILYSSNAQNAISASYDKFIIKKIGNAIYVSPNSIEEIAKFNSSEDLINALIIKNNQFYRINSNGTRDKILINNRI